MIFSFILYFFAVFGFLIFAYIIYTTIYNYYYIDESDSGYEFGDFVIFNKILKEYTDKKIIGGLEEFFEDKQALAVIDSAKQIQKEFGSNLLTAIVYLISKEKLTKSQRLLIFYIVYGIVRDGVIGEQLRNVDLL